jgi:beta-galactosidase GanA
VNERTLEPFAVLFEAFAPFARDWARIGLEHPTWGVAKPDDQAEQTIALGRWNATVHYDQWQFGRPEWTWLPRDPPSRPDRVSGGAMIAALGEGDYLVFAQNARIEFALADPAAANGVLFDRVEEGHFTAGEWVMDRVWNGDQTDYGLNFTARPRLLRVTLATY